MIQYVKGDATRPQGGGDKILLHICNQEGGWGRGFVTAINQRWPEPEIRVERSRSLPEYIYRSQHAKGNSKLGDVHFVPMETKDGTNLWIVNMVAQDGYKSEKNPVPLSYVHLGRCLDEVRTFVDQMQKLGVGLSVHCPKIGAGLGGGDWDLISNRLRVHLPEQAITIYEL